MTYTIQTHRGPETIDEAEAESLDAAKLAARTLLEDLDDTTGAAASVYDESGHLVWVTGDGRRAR